MRTLPIGVALVLVASLARAQALPIKDGEAFYSAGYIQGQYLGRFGLTPHERQIVLQGAMDAATNAKYRYPEIRTIKTVDAVLKKILARTNKQRMDAAAKEPGAQRTKSGLVYIEKRAGTGPSPGAKDKVLLRYRGTVSSGREFVNTDKRGDPAAFSLGYVIPCWTEGIQKMKVGGTAVLVCPPDLGYGDDGYKPQVPPTEVLRFQIELVDVQPGTGNPIMHNWFPHPWTPTLPDGGTLPN